MLETEESVSEIDSHCNDIDVIVLFTSGPHLRHNYHGNKTLETMLSGSVELVGHRLNRPVLLHLCVCRVLPINNATVITGYWQFELTSTLVSTWLAYIIVVYSFLTRELRACARVSCRYDVENGIRSLARSIGRFL